MPLKCRVSGLSHTERDGEEQRGKSASFRKAGRSFELVASGEVQERETGIGKWTRSQFVDVFRSRGKPEGAFPVKPGESQTSMPWNMYGGMSPEDLGAIYDYLRTVPAVRNAVPSFEPPRRASL